MKDLTNHLKWVHYFLVSILRQSTTDVREGACKICSYRAHLQMLVCTITWLLAVADHPEVESDAA